MNHKVSLSFLFLILSTVRGEYKPCCSHMDNYYNTQNRGNLYPRKFDEEFDGDGQDFFVLKDYPENKQDERFFNAKHIPKSFFLDNLMKKSNDPEFNFERRLLKRSDNIYEDAITRLLKRSKPNDVYERAVLGLLKRSTDNIYNSAITRSL